MRQLFAGLVDNWE